MKRQAMKNRSKDQRVFSKTAQKVHQRNYTSPGLKRGGQRM